MRIEENRIKISIIVPVFNAEQYLRQCVNSLREQTYSNIEIICIDDKSTDNSLKILNEFRLVDNRIRVLTRNYRSGVSEARNRGLDEAIGDFVMFVDSDDWIDQETCQCALDNILQNDIDVVMWSYVREFTRKSARKEIFSSNIMFDREAIKNKLHRRFVGIIDNELLYPEKADALCTIWGKLYKRDLIDKNNIRFVDINRIGSYEDGLFNLEVFRYVQSAKFINKYYYHYRKTNECSITSKYNKKLIHQKKALYALMDNYIAKYNLELQYATALNNRKALDLLTIGLNIIISEQIIISKVNLLKDFISSHDYREALESFQYNCLSLKWKLFYGFAKKRFYLAVFVMLCVINIIRKHRL